MIAGRNDLAVLTEADFDRLPDDGLFEVVDGRAILMPGNDIPHQKISIAIFEAIRRCLTAGARGHVFPTVNVFIPRPPDSFGEVQNRIPDLVLATFEPKNRFDVGRPPELVIEILSSRRGNVERTEKLDDYALAGVGGYWIVNPFDRAIEVYRLEGDDYRLVREVREGVLRPREFPGVEIDVDAMWAAAE